MGILSRYPAMALDISPFVEQAGQVQIARIFSPGGVVVVYNIHLQCIPLLHAWQAGLPLAAEVRLNAQQRLTFVQTLLADIEQRGEPVIVVGDFNSTDQSDIYQQLTRHLMDAHRVAGWGFGHTFPAASASFREIPLFAHFSPLASDPDRLHIWYAYTFKPTQLLRIDMIFYSSALMAVQSRVSEWHGDADHLPVLATLRWTQ